VHDEGVGDVIAKEANECGAEREHDNPSQGHDSTYIYFAKKRRKMLFKIFPR
jgi:hypothetical protein